MKRLIISLSFCVLLVLCLSPIVYAAEIDDITIYVDKEKVDLDTKPIIRNNRTLIPIRGVLEKLGATVDWNKETNQVIVKNQQMEILLETGNSAVLVDGKIDFMDTQSMIIDNRTLVPLRFIAESLGYDVQWDNKTHRIDIKTIENKDIVDDTLPSVENIETLAQLLKYSHTLNTYIDYRFMPMDDLDLEVKEALNGSVIDEALNEPEFATATETKESGDYSNTNNQTEGVEEGDITKTNGDYIFYTKNNEVFIIDSQPQSLNIASTISVSTERGYIRDIYIQEQQLVIIGTSYTSYSYPLPLLMNSAEKFAPYYYTNNTFVLVYDFKEVTAPKKVMDMDFEGNYISSRVIDDKMYMVTNKNIDYYNVENLLMLKDDGNKEKELYTYEIQPKYANNMTKEIVAIDFEDIYYFPTYIAPSYMLTIGIDLTTKETQVTSYLGSAETVYASLDHLYLTYTNYEYTNENEGLLYIPNYKVNTSIYKFDLNQGQIIYNNEGKVEGTILNQFSLNEHLGNLQIATTKNQMWNQKDPSTNNVYILDKSLSLIGSVEGLAEGEQIYSTRFSGDRIYMVTFKQIDPFFVIDASNPKDPKVLGQLKIPGFSTYMHILDDHHILGFGTETIEKENFTTSGGFKISLFDVTDPTNPIESKKEVIGVEGTYSELKNNHKALMISLSKGIMGFPISVTTTPYVTDFVGAYLYDITTNDFNFKGFLTHKNNTKVEFNYEDNIDRLLYIGDYVYSLSTSKLKVTNLNTMETVGELAFPMSTNRGEIYYLD